MKRLIIILLTAILLFSMLSVSVLAVSEGEVEAQVAARGKEKVTGSIFIWFLCAIAFLKISQKIDSFMQTLGIGVGRTGGSMLGELMIGMRGFTALKGGKSSGGGGRSSSGASGTSAAFLSGGLAGAVGRSFERSATASITNSSSNATIGQFFSKMAYQNSVSKGGDFANNIIGSVAKGDPKSVGTIVGQNASDAMTSYFGFTGKPNAPSFRDVEIGGGKIIGKEITTTNPNPTEFAMYNADQYMQPEGKFTTETASDGSKWYKQTPQDVVEKTPYYDANGDVKYNETIVQKMPQVPRRKDRV